MTPAAVLDAVVAALAAISAAEWIAVLAGARLPAARGAPRTRGAGPARSRARPSSSCCSPVAAWIMQAALQVFYIGMGGYGWWAWRRGSREGSELPVSRLDARPVTPRRSRCCWPWRA